MHLQFPSCAPPLPLPAFISKISSDLTFLSLPPLPSPASSGVDVYGDFMSPKSDDTNSYLRMFEKEVSTHLGMEDGVFMPSGVMAQSIVLKIAGERKGGGGGGDGGGEGVHVETSEFVCHETSHILVHEKDSYSHLLNASPLMVESPDPMSPSSVRSKMSSSPSCVILEHPHRELGGAVNPHSDLGEIRDICKSGGCHFHLDGARLFEATGAYGGKHSASDICSHFDSVYVSFYKGLGGPAGAMLLGDRAFVEEARVWLRRFGGNLHTLAPLWVGCWAGYRRNVKAPGEGVGMTFADKASKLREVVRAIKGDDVAGRNVDFVPEVPEVCMVHVVINKEREICERAERETFEKVRTEGRLARQK